MNALDHLTKRYGEQAAVDHLSCTLRSGAVTGFLGSNGAGKSTTMRMTPGLVRPSSGTAAVNGRQHVDLDTPLRTVGALLDPRTGHPGQSARSHLLGMAGSNGLPARRVDEVLGTVGLSEVEQQRVRTSSLGMGQRLGVASGLLGDPEILIVDEPVSGRGTLIVDAPVDEVIGQSALDSVRIRSPHAPALQRELAGLGMSVVRTAPTGSA